MIRDGFRNKRRLTQARYIIAHTLLQVGERQNVVSGRAYSQILLNLATNWSFVNVDMPQSV